jgi:hypothetical protein
MDKPHFTEEIPASDQAGIVFTFPCLSPSLLNIFP